jgi:hypothetical protein
MSIAAEAAARVEEVPETKPEKKKRLQGVEVNIPEPDPWPEPVDGAAVLTRVVEAVQRHMAIRDPDAYLVALWCAHTHVFKAFTHTPRLAITGPAPECGKSVLLCGLVRHLVSKPFEADNISPAPFFRLAAAKQPTFLIDEVDAWLKEDSALPGALNNGWERHGQVVRCEGDGFEVRAFPTHSPVALAGIGLGKKLTAATLTRCLTIELERALPGEVEQPFDQRRHDEPLRVLCRQLARWTGDSEREIGQCDPQMPQGVLNRRADKWRSLFALAEVAGGLWPEWIKCALLSEEDGNTYTREIQLLGDIRVVLAQGDYQPGIFTEELIAALCEAEDSVWADYNFRAQDKRIKPRQLSNLLAGFKCKPDTIRRDTGRRKGYYTDKLQTAIQRYLPDPGMF